MLVQNNFALISKNIAFCADNSEKNIISNKDKKILEQNLDLFETMANLGLINKVALAEAKNKSVDKVLSKEIILHDELLNAINNPKFTYDIIKRQYSRTTYINANNIQKILNNIEMEANPEDVEMLKKIDKSIDYKEFDRKQINYIMGNNLVNNAISKRNLYYLDKYGFYPENFSSYDLKTAIQNTIKTIEYFG